MPRTIRIYACGFYIRHLDSYEIAIEAVSSYTGKKNTPVVKTTSVTTTKTPEKPYVSKNSVFINDGTPGGTVKVEIETIGNSNFEASRITNTYTGSSATKIVNKVTGEAFVSKNIVGTTSTTALTTIWKTGTARNLSVLIPRGSAALIPHTTTLSKGSISNLQFKAIIPENVTGNTGNGQQQIGTQGKSGNNKKQENNRTNNLNNENIYNDNENLIIGNEDSGVENNSQNDFMDRGRISGSQRMPLNQPKNPLYQPLRNEDRIINGRTYSGHALDRMQDRGIPISVVEETIKYGKKTVSYSDRIKYYDEKNNVTVVTEKNGKVVMTRRGK